MPNIKPLHLQTVFDPYTKRTSRDNNASIQTNSRPQALKTAHSKKYSHKENLKIDLKEGLYGAHRFNDSHFKAILRNSNCSSAKNSLSLKKVQYCLGSMDRGICNLSSTTRNLEVLSTRQDYQQLRDTPLVVKLDPCRPQKVRENREKKFIQTSPTPRIVTHPGEHEIRRHSMAPPNLPYNSPRKHNAVDEMDSPSRYFLNATEPLQVSQANKFTFLGALTTDEGSYDEENGTQTSRFPENVGDMNEVNDYESNPVVAQENFQIDVKFSKEKNLLTKMRTARKNSKNRKKSMLPL